MFLEHKIHYLDIIKLNEACCEAHKADWLATPNLEDICHADAEARRWVKEQVRGDCAWLCVVCHVCSFPGLGAPCICADDGGGVLSNLFVCVFTQSQVDTGAFKSKVMVGV